MAQQTAVEWLVWELERCGYFEINDHFPITFEQALKREVEQMKNMWRGGQWSAELGGEFEQYYNETYGK